MTELRTIASPQAVTGAATGVQNVLKILADNWKLILAVPVLAGIIAVAATPLLPKRYASSTTLLMSDTMARGVETLMRSPAVLDVVIAAHPDLPGDTLPQKRRNLNERISWSVTPGDARRTAAIFYMTVEDQIPARAQAAAKAMLEQWLLLSKPRPDAKIRLEADLVRVETRIREAEVLLGQLSGEAKLIVAPNTMQGELATPLDRLRSNRDALVQQALKIRQDLLGGSRDVILTPPDLPVEHVWQRRSGMLPVAAMLISLTVLLAGLILRGSLQAANKAAALR